MFVPRPHPRLHKGYGWKPKAAVLGYELFDATVEEVTLPPRADLRADFPPPFDQGALMSCTGNGWAAAVQYVFKRQGLPDFTPSRLFIYYNERVHDKDTAADDGAAVSDGAGVVTRLGCPHEALWPYDVSQVAVVPTPPVYADGLKHKVAHVKRVAQTRTAMKQALANGMPIVLGINVFESFESKVVEQTGLVPTPGPDEKQVGGHCMVAVGYDDAKRAIIVRNSWGASWGLGGDCWIPYEFLTNHRLASDFWTAGIAE